MSGLDLRALRGTLLAVGFREVSSSTIEDRDPGDEDDGEEKRGGRWASDPARVYVREESSVMARFAKLVASLPLPAPSRHPGAMPAPVDDFEPRFDPTRGMRVVADASAVPLHFEYGRTDLDPREVFLAAERRRLDLMVPQDLADVAKIQAMRDALK